MGYSLVEIMVAGTLFAIMTVAVMGVYRVALKAESVTAQRIKLQDGLQYGMKAFDKEISEASGSLSTSSSTSLSLAIPIFDANGVPTGLTDTVRFTASGSEVYQTVIPGLGSNRPAFANKRLLQHLPAPYPSPGLFSYWKREGGSLVPKSPQDATIVRVSLYQTDVYSGRRQTVHLSQDIRMRNR